MYKSLSIESGTVSIVHYFYNCVSSNGIFSFIQPYFQCLTLCQLFPLETLILISNTLEWITYFFLSFLQSWIPPPHSHNTGN